MVSTADPNDPMPTVVRGTLITMRRRCGKPTCRCATGQRHESPALSVSVDGHSVTISLRQGEVPAVQEALARYRAARQDLETQAADGIAALRARRRR